MRLPLRLAAAAVLAGVVAPVAAPASSPARVAVVCDPVRWLDLEYDRVHHRFLLATGDLGVGAASARLAQVDRLGASILAGDRCHATALSARRLDPLTKPQAAGARRGVGCVPSEYELGNYVNAPNGTIGVVLEHLKTGGNRLTLVHKGTVAVVATVTPRKATVSYAPFYCR